MKPYTKPLQAWKQKTNLKRLYDCVFNLYVHGFMTDGERKRVIRRIHKWLDTYEAAAKSAKEGA